MYDLKYKEDKHPTLDITPRQKLTSAQLKELLKRQIDTMSEGQGEMMAPGGTMPQMNPMMGSTPAMPMPSMSMNPMMGGAPQGLDLSGLKAVLRGINGGSI
jgi:hypothetical protein